MSFACWKALFGGGGLHFWKATLGFRTFPFWRPKISDKLNIYLLARSSFSPYCTCPLYVSWKGNKPWSKTHHWKSCPGKAEISSALKPQLRVECYPSLSWPFGHEIDGQYFFAIQCESKIVKMKLQRATDTENDPLPSFCDKNERMSFSLYFNRKLVRTFSKRMQHNISNWHGRHSSCKLWSKKTVEWDARVNCAIGDRKSDIAGFVCELFNFWLGWDKLSGEGKQIMVGVRAGTFSLSEYNRVSSAKQAGYQLKKPNRCDNTGFWKGHLIHNGGTHEPNTIECCNEIKKIYKLKGGNDVLCVENQMEG